MNTWGALGAVPPMELTDARLQLHHAVQVLAAFGQTLVAPRSDDSHRSMTWDAHAGRFLSGCAEHDGRLQVGFRPQEFTIALLRRGRVLSEESHLSGDIESIYGWVEAEIGKELGNSGPVHLDRPEYDMADHPVARGGRFSPDIGVELGELGTWFAYASEALDQLTTGEPHATPVRCWPHHFDLATLVLLDPEIGAVAGRSVGVGFSPGDLGIDQPYWYVNAYPRPDVDSPPPLPEGGHWNTDGWFGAVLPGDRIVEAGDWYRSPPRTLTERFLTTAVESVKDILLDSGRL